MIRRSKQPPAEVRLPREADPSKQDGSPPPPAPATNPAPGVDDVNPSSQSFGGPLVGPSRRRLARGSGPPPDAEVIEISDDEVIEISDDEVVEIIDVDEETIPVSTSLLPWSMCLLGIYSRPGKGVVLTDLLLM
jgi:hypothetical protein